MVSVPSASSRRISQGRPQRFAWPEVNLQEERRIVELLPDTRDKFVQSGRPEHTRARKFLFLAFREVSQVRLKLSTR